MTILTTPHLRPGMTLAGDVRDMRGRLLLGQGELISDKHLKIFRTWGITEADVVTPEGDQERPLPPHAFEPELHVQAVAYARDKFAHNDLTHPFINELFTHAVLLLYRRLENPEGRHGP